MRAYSAAALDGSLAGQHRGLHPAVIEPGIPATLILTLQQSGGLRIAPEHDQILRRKVALDRKTPQRGRKIERCPSHRLPQRSGGAQSVRRSRRLKGRVEVLAHETKSSRRGAGANRLGFEQHNLDAGRGERPRARAARQPSANNDDTAFERTAQPRIGRATCFGNAVEPVRGMACGHGMGFRLWASGFGLQALGFRLWASA